MLPSLRPPRARERKSPKPPPRARCCRVDALIEEGTDAASSKSGVSRQTGTHRSMLSAKESDLLDRAHRKLERAESKVAACSDAASVRSALTSASSKRTPTTLPASERPPPSASEGAPPSEDGGVALVNYTGQQSAVAGIQRLKKIDARAAKSSMGALLEHVENDEGQAMRKSFPGSGRTALAMQNARKRGA